MRLDDMQKMVETELKTRPYTRNSDRQLIKYVYSDFYDVNDAPFWQVMDDINLPSFETIRRTRQKLQQTREDLRAVAGIEAERIAKQEEYLEYARR